jgi:hypothetical protein
MAILFHCKFVTDRIKRVERPTVDIKSYKVSQDRSLLTPSLNLKLWILAIESIWRGVPSEM